MWGARYTKCFNTLTSAFQAEAAGRQGEKRVVQWLCGDDANAKEVVAGLVEDAGFVPVDLGGTAECSVMEAPRREGAVYGEEYRASDARAVVDAVRAGRPRSRQLLDTDRPADDAPGEGRHVGDRCALSRPHASITPARRSSGVRLRCSHGLRENCDPPRNGRDAASSAGLQQEHARAHVSRSARTSIARMKSAGEDSERWRDPAPLLVTPLGPADV